MSKAQKMKAFVARQSQLLEQQLAMADAAAVGGPAEGAGGLASEPGTPPSAASDGEAMRAAQLNAKRAAAQLHRRLRG